MQNKIFLPLAIIIAGGLIAGALYFGGNGDRVSNDAEEPSFEKMSPVSEGDHIFGNPSAPIKLVEYSDTQCPYCRAFHQTMKMLMADFAPEGKVAWVYRHFAILGPESVTEAHATECAADQGGDEMFWKFIDAMFTAKNENARFPVGASIETVAEGVGLDMEKFRTCQESIKFEEKILAERQNAANAGAQGTPYTLIVNAENELMAVIPGALPYESAKQVVEEALKNI